jgi:hypothetical protein
MKNRGAQLPLPLQRLFGLVQFALRSSESSPNIIAS